MFRYAYALAGLMALRRGGVVAPRGTVGVHDAARQQIRQVLPGPRRIGGIDVIEASILADDHDHVPDRRRRILIVQSLPAMAAAGIGRRLLRLDSGHARQRQAGRNPRNQSVPRMPCAA